MKKAYHNLTSRCEHSTWTFVLETTGLLWNSAHAARSQTMHYSIIILRCQSHPIAKQFPHLVYSQPANILAMIFRLQSLRFARSLPPVKPKSGTGTSEEWAAAALAAVCAFLRSLYGERSCEINILDKFHAEMIFEPGRAAANTTTPCVCTDVER